MMKKFFLFFALISILSCTKDEEPITTVTPPSTVLPPPSVTPPVIVPPTVIEPTPYTTGDISISSREELDAYNWQEVKIVTGNLILLIDWDFVSGSTNDPSVFTSKIEQVTGDVTINTTSEISLESLVKVGGDYFVSGHDVLDENLLYAKSIALDYQGDYEVKAVYTDVIGLNLSDGAQTAKPNASHSKNESKRTVFIETYHTSLLVDEDFTVDNLPEIRTIPPTMPEIPIFVPFIQLDFVVSYDISSTFPATSLPLPSLNLTDYVVSNDVSSSIQSDNISNFTMGGHVEIEKIESNSLEKLEVNNTALENFEVDCPVLQQFEMPFITEMDNLKIVAPALELFVAPVLEKITNSLFLSGIKEILLDALVEIKILEIFDVDILSIEVIVEIGEAILPANVKVESNSESFTQTPSGGGGGGVASGSTGGENNAPSHESGTNGHQSGTNGHQSGTSGHQSGNSGFAGNQIKFENGICKCPDAQVGYKEANNGKTYTVVDDISIRQEIASGNYNLCTTQVTKMNDLFSGNSSFNSNIGFWDTSNVTDISAMFSGASSFNQDINNWDVSKVIYMDNTFNGASSFNKPLNKWDTSSAIVMYKMFFKATEFNQPIENWDVSSVTSMASMFSVFSDEESDSEDVSEFMKFNQAIGNWNVANVIDMSFMFGGAKAFNKDIGNWDTSSVVTTVAMFSLATSFNQDIGKWDTSNVNDMGAMFVGALSFNQNIGSWDVSNVTNMVGLFLDAVSFNQPIGGWDVSNVTNMSLMFRADNALEDHSFNQDIGKWNVSKVTDMVFMFNRSLFNNDIGNWDISSVTDMEGMFAGAQVFNQDLSLWCVQDNFDEEPLEFNVGANDKWTTDSTKQPLWDATSCPPGPGPN